MRLRAFSFINQKRKKHYEYLIKRLLGRGLSDQERAIRDLYQDKEMAQMTLRSIGDGVIATDVEGRVQFLNPVAEKMTGWKHKQAIGLPFGQVVNLYDDATREPYPDPVKNYSKAGHTVKTRENKLLIGRDGGEFVVKDSASPICDKDGNVFGTVFVVTDVTETDKLTKELSYQAAHDHLTGLINRREFEGCLERVFNSAKKHNSESILCYIDIDQFKLINDTAGHHAGDELMRVLVNSIDQNHHGEHYESYPMCTRPFSCLCSSVIAMA